MVNFNYFNDCDDEDDFGFYNPEESEDDSDVISSLCKNPWSHKFENKELFNSRYRECSYCDYSPELDGRVEKYLKCHKDFLDWERKSKK